MYRSILVPLDGSPLSEHALSVACELARRSGALLRLVHVHVVYTAAPIYVEGMPVIDEQMHSLGKAHEHTYLERIRDRLIGESELPITIAVLDPTDADVHEQTIPQMLANYAATTDTDLTVMTTHGRGGLARFWLGSVADTLARTSPTPIFLVRPDGGTMLAEHAPAFRQILIPLDGSALAEQILEPARTLGRLMQTEFTLLHVVEPRTLIRSAPFTTPTDFDAEDTQRAQKEAQRYLERVAQSLLAADVTANIEVRVGDEVALAILDEARERRVDLLAIATHGRSGLTRLLLGPGVTVTPLAKDRARALGLTFERTKP